MLQAFRTVEIPSVTGVEASKHLLERFAHTDLPVMMVHEAGFEMPQVLESLRKYLPDGISQAPRSIEFEFGDAGKDGHVGLHQDYMPPAAGEELLAVSNHLNHVGEADVSIAGIGRQFVDLMHGPNDPRILQRQARADLGKGLVDPNLINPIVYRGRIRPGTYTLFKNGFPYWHLFDTIGSGRRSTVFDSEMVIRPGMGVQFRTEPLPPRQYLFNIDMGEADSL